MRVAVFGDINIDVAVAVPSLPGPGEESFATGGRVGLGGSAANTAIALARLGVQTEMVAQVGVDVFGAAAVAELASAGVGVESVGRTGKATTGFNLLAVTDDAERTMIGLRGANAAYEGDLEWVAGIDWLHMSAYALRTEPQSTAARAALAAAAAAGVPVSVDVPSGIGTGLGERLLADLVGCRLVSAGIRALDAIIGGSDPARRLLQAGVGRVAVTAGEGLCRLVDIDGEVALTPPKIEPVDTTGAGDSFVAGMVAAELAGLAAGPTLTLATALGAAATTHPGAGTALGHSWHALLLDETWADAEPAWLAEAATIEGRLVGL